MAASTPQVIAYADGGCRGNPGAGGWGFLVINSATGDALERAGGERETTNNRMELTAAIRALQALRKPGMSVRLHSDSEYVIKGMSEWLAGWKRRGWKRADKGPVKNADLWQELDRIASTHQVEWRWVKGHAGDPGNECADGLTNLAMDRVQSGADPSYERRRRWP